MSKDEAIPHIIFYGPDGSGKKTTIRLFLEMLFDVTVHKTRETPYKVVGSSNKTVLEKIKQSNYHITIDPKGTNFDRYLIHDVVKEYAKRGIINAFKTKRSFKIVLINNIDSMSHNPQASLRRTMERYNKNVRFILWCRSLSKVIKPLQSRCMCIRIPSPSDLELFGYIFKISIKENIKLTLDQYVKIIDRANGNIKIALWELDFCRFNYEMSTDYYESIDKIIKLILEPILSNVIKIRDIIFTLMITNFTGTTIMRDLLDSLCINKSISSIAKQKILQECVEFEYQLVKGRREIIQFDGVITTVMRIIHQENGLIDETAIIKI
jgi:replication factor C subunit 3/5